MNLRNLSDFQENSNKNFGITQKQRIRWISKIIKKYSFTQSKSKIKGLENRISFFQQVRSEFTQVQVIFKSQTIHSALKRNSEETICVKGERSL